MLKFVVPELKIMKTTIPTVKLKSSRKRTYPDKVIWDGFNVYVESNVTTLIDKFFSDHKIYSLGFKCKTWNRMVSMAQKIEVAAMKEFFGADDGLDIKYSHKTGCSCGCSPGFKVRKAFSPAVADYKNCDVWLNLKLDTTEIKKMLPLFEAKLKVELLEQKKLATA